MKVSIIRLAYDASVRLPYYNSTFDFALLEIVQSISHPYFAYFPQHQLYVVENRRLWYVSCDFFY